MSTKFKILSVSVLGLVVLTAKLATAETLYIEPPKPPSVTSTISSSTIKSIILGLSKEHKVNPSVILFIVSHESQFNPNTVGDDDKICPVGLNKGKLQHSRGLWQISDCFHPEVPDEIAFDIVSSTIWSIQNIKNGHINEWSTWKYRCKLYGICDNNVL